MNLRNLSRTVLFIAFGFIQTSFASEVKELIESPIRLDNPLYRLNENSFEEKTLVLKDEKKNDDSCKSVYMSMHKKYLYLRENYLLPLTFFAMQYLAYYALCPADFDITKMSDMTAAQPYIVAIPSICALYFFAEVVLESPSRSFFSKTEWKKDKERSNASFMNAYNKYLYLKQNGLLIPVLLALESLTYDIIAPQENPHMCHPLDEGNVYLNYGGSQYNIIRLFPTMLVQFWVGYIYTMTCLYFEAFKPRYI